MKRLICAMLALLLLALGGCTVVVDGIETDSMPTRAGDRTLPASSAAVPIESDTETPSTAPVPEIDLLSGVEMALTEDLTATPGCPWVELRVSFPQVRLPAESRVCSLTVELDGEPVAEWPELELEPGLEEQVELEFSFNRYQPDRIATVSATLRRGEDSLTRETEVQVDNYPEELYAALSADKWPYSIDVLRNQNMVIIYGRDEEDAYTVPVRVCLCTTGRATPLGRYRLGYKKEWGLLFGGVYGQYVSVIQGNILFHSVPYRRMEKDSLKTAEYNKLGTTASMGCVRLACADAKWIYDNCPTGTDVHIYDTDELPVERPEALTLDPEDPRAGWDPTDPDPENPWSIDN